MTIYRVVHEANFIAEQILAAIQVHHPRRPHNHWEAYTVAVAVICAIVFRGAPGLMPACTVWRETPDGWQEDVAWLNLSMDVDEGLLSPYIFSDVLLMIQARSWTGEYQSSITLFWWRLLSLFTGQCPLTPLRFRLVTTAARIERPEGFVDWPSLDISETLPQMSLRYFIHPARIW